MEKDWPTQLHNKAVAKQLEQLEQKKQDALKYVETVVLPKLSAAADAGRFEETLEYYYADMVAAHLIQKFNFNPKAIKIAHYDDDVPTITISW